MNYDLHHLFYQQISLSCKKKIGISDLHHLNFNPFTYLYARHTRRSAKAIQFVMQYRRVFFFSTRFKSTTRINVRVIIVTRRQSNLMYPVYTLSTKTRHNVRIVYYWTAKLIGISIRVRLSVARVPAIVKRLRFSAATSRIRRVRFETGNRPKP